MFFQMSFSLELQNTGGHSAKVYSVQSVSICPDKLSVQGCVGSDTNHHCHLIEAAPRPYSTKVERTSSSMTEASYYIILNHIIRPPVHNTSCGAQQWTDRHTYSACQRGPSLSISWGGTERPGLRQFCRVSSIIHTRCVAGLIV